jgi:hypothetical protein
MGIMKKYKIIITSLICTFLALNFAFSSLNFSDSQQFANIEFEAESESESENNNNKSKLGYLGKEFNVNFYLTNFFNFNFSSNSPFCQSFICEVPTSPPNNC